MNRLHCGWVVVAVGALMTCVGMGAMFSIPVSLLVRKPPSMVVGPAWGTGGQSDSLRAMAWRALRSRQFAVLALTFFACCAAHSGPIFHTVSYAMVCGLPALTAVAIYGVEGLAGLAGRLLLGVLADQRGAKRVLVPGLLVQALAAGAYAFASRLGDFYALAFVFGLAYGGVMPLYSVLAREYFAPQIMGTVLGAAAFASSLGMALGPAVGGWIYDAFNGYTWLYVASLAIGVGAAAVALAFPPIRPSGSRSVPQVA